MLGAIWKIRNICIMAWGVVQMVWDDLIHRHRNPK